MRAPSAAETAQDGLLLDRACGGVRLHVDRREGETRVSVLRQDAPCRALFPRTAPGEPLAAVLVNTSGGLVEGDEVTTDVIVGAGARIDVTTQAAEKVYRSLRRTCRVTTRLQAAAGGELAWRPLETILFDGARLSRRLEIDLAADAVLNACECVIFGRIARGESFERGALEDRWLVRVEGDLVWADALRVDPSAGFQRAARFAFGDAVGFATLVRAGPGTEEALAPARAIAAEGPWRAGVTFVNGLLVARALDTNEARLRLVAGRLADTLRATRSGHGARA